MKKAVPAGRPNRMEKKWREDDNRRKGGPLDNDAATSGLDFREALGEDNGAVTKVESEVCPFTNEKYEVEHTNKGGGKVF